MLEWYKNLYVGDNVKKNKSSIIRKINHKKATFGIYLITAASNPENLLEIIAANQLLMPMQRKLCPVIVGIAGDYTEALEIVQKIITETYQAEKNTDVRRYLQKKERRGKGGR